MNNDPLYNRRTNLRQEMIHRQNLVSETQYQISGEKVCEKICSLKVYQTAQMIMAYAPFGKEFEEKYIGQGAEENRTIEETLDLGWELLGRLPREELDRVNTKILDKYYHQTKREDGVTTSATPGSVANKEL